MKVKIYPSAFSEPHYREMTPKEIVEYILQEAAKETTTGVVCSKPQDACLEIYTCEYPIP